KMGVRITGNKTYIYEDPEHQAKEQLKAMGLLFADDITVASGKDNWQLEFDPKTRHLKVSTDNGKPLYETQLFGKLAMQRPANPDTNQAPSRSHHPSR